MIRANYKTPKTVSCSSHIKPWRSSSNVERLDGSNGLMLAPHVDLLFDQGYISFENNGDVIVNIFRSIVANTLLTIACKCFYQLALKALVASRNSYSRIYCPLWRTFILYKGKVFPIYHQNQIVVVKVVISNLAGSKV